MHVLMAISDVLLSMNVDDTKVVHPFFSKFQEKEPQLSTVDTTEHQPTDEGCHREPESGKHLAKIPETSSIRNHGYGDRLAMGTGKGLEYKGGDDFDVDLNRARRKRHKSNEAEDPLQMKLTLTGHVEKPEKPTSSQAKTETTPSSGVTSSQPVPENVASLDRKSTPDSQLVTLPTTFPGQKVLKLSGKGTLGSPVKKDKDTMTDKSGEKEKLKTVREAPNGGEPSKRLVGRPKRKRDPQSLLVKLGYNNPETGKSIDRILLGEQQVSTEPSNQPEPPKRPIVIKPTHPFFTKKTKPNNVERNSVTESNTPTSLSRSATPSEASTKARSVWPFPRSSGHDASSTSIMRRQGNRHPPFPWQGVAHIRGMSNSLPDRPNTTMPTDPVPKQKGVSSFISSMENVLHKLSCQTQLESALVTFQLPSKLIYNNAQVQDLVANQLSADLRFDDDLPMAKARHQTHIAIDNLFGSIKQCMTPWDLNRCETQSWTSKYAPTMATCVLQSGPEAIILRNWLQTHKINIVGTGKSQLPKIVVEKPKKKRKRPSDMDDFIVSESEDELGYGEMTDIEDRSRSPREWSQARRGALDKKLKDKVRTANIVVISGPSGCGKTAAVYAVAKELDFEVFEINSSSRRSGRDILDRIGDMAENHLVQIVSKTIASSENKVEPTDADVSRQHSLNAFLGGGTKKPTAKGQTEVSPQREQKQSLILFEEVDVLFQEDKQFWPTVLALAMHSKRPLILTCNNEQFIPLESLALHAVLRFRPPPTAIATDYLLLMAAREGHLLQRKAVEDLYELNKRDLRSSITTLDFWCQMAIGDQRGGLDWMLDRWPQGIDLDSSGLRLRAISKDTYHQNLDLLPNNSASLGRNDDYQLLKISISDWDLSLEDLAMDPNLVSLDSTTSLSAWEIISDTFSATDVFCQTSLRTGKKVHLYREALDPTNAGLPEAAKADVVEGSNPIASDPPVDFDQLDIGITSAIILTSRDLLNSASQIPPVQTVCLQILKRSLSVAPVALTRASFLALDPLGEDESAVFRSSTSSYTLSSIDREFSVLIHDIGPYVRAIEYTDLKAESERAAESLSSVKRQRMTKAARSAVEGVRRDEMYEFRAGRRERWFGNDLNPREVLETGGNWTAFWECSRPDGEEKFETSEQVQSVPEAI